MAHRRIPFELGDDGFDLGRIDRGRDQRRDDLHLILALLLGLDRVIQAETGMPVRVAKNPLYSVVLGSGYCLEQFDVLRQVLISGPSD